MPEYHLIPEFLFPLRRALARGGVAIDVPTLATIANDQDHADQNWACQVLSRSPMGRFRGGRLALSATSAALLDQDIPVVSTAQLRYLQPKAGYSLVRVTVDASPWRVLAALSHDADMARGLDLGTGDIAGFTAHFLEIPRAVAKVALYSALFGVQPGRVAEALEANDMNTTAEEVISNVRGLYSASFAYLDSLNAYGRHLGRTSVQQLANRNAHQMLAAVHDALTDAAPGQAIPLDATAVLLTSPDSVLYQVAGDHLKDVDRAIRAMAPGVNGVPAVCGQTTAMLVPQR